MAQIETTNARWRAATIAVAPVALLAAFIFHPFLANATDKAAVGEAAAADTTRWGLSHLAFGVATGVSALAFLAIRGYLREAGEERWSGLALPFAIMGSTLFAILPGMEFAPMIAAETGGDAQAAQIELDTWFLPVLVTAAATLALGLLGFAMGIARAGVLNPRLTRLVIVALVVMAVARFAPLSAAFYVGGVAGLVALWPLAYAICTQPEVRPVEQARFMPAA